MTWIGVKERGGDSFGITRVQQSMAKHNTRNPHKKDTIGYNNVETISTIIFAKYKGEENAAWPL